MSENSIEREIVNELERGDQSTEEEASKLERDVKKGNQTRETKKNLGNLRRNTFIEKKGPNGKYIFYKLDTVNNYLKEVSTSNSKIKESLFNDRKTIVMAVQIALYKSGYLPVGWIDGQRGPITRSAVAKFQKGNGLGKQKNPGYLNVNTLNKLIEVSSEKENQQKKKQRKIEKPALKKIPTLPATSPKESTRIEPDNTRVYRKPIFTKKEKLNPKKITLQKKQVENIEKGGTMEEVRLDITKKVGNFREWHNSDYRFAFYNTDNINGELPDSITVCGETYKYNGEGNDLNGLGFETYDGGRAFQLGSYTSGTLKEGFRFYFDGEKEVGEFDYVGDLKNGIRIDTNGEQHKIENGNEVNI